MGALQKIFQESWEAFNARQQAERDQWLMRAIGELDEWYAKLGPVGQKFKSDFAATKCGEHIDLDIRARAALNTHHMTRGFLNTISYNRDVLDDARDLFSSRTHEGVHAIQYSQSAAAQATPYNCRVKIMLCPRDAILLQELKERDALSKQWLFDAMLDDHLALPDGSYQPQSLAMLEAALQNHARTILEKTNNFEGKTFLESYRDMTIRDYEGMMASRHQKEGDIIYVRLDPDDVIEIGHNLGLHSFGRNAAEAAEWMQSSPLTAVQEATLSAIHADLGLQSTAALPTLAEALQARGLTKAGFVAQSHAKPPESGPKPAPTPCL